jgi:hypothetical protein
MLRVTPRLQAALPWIVLGLTLGLATEPVWSIPMLGFNPTQDELLLIGRCLSRPLHNS